MSELAADTSVYKLDCLELDMFRSFSDDMVTKSVEYLLSKSSPDDSPGMFDNMMPVVNTLSVIIAGTSEMVTSGSHKVSREAMGASLGFGGHKYEASSERLSSLSPVSTESPRSTVIQE